MPKNWTKKVKKFLQQKEDYIWLTSPHNAPDERNHYRASSTTEPYSSAPGAHNAYETRRNNVKTVEPYSGNPEANAVQEPRRDDAEKQVAPNYERQASNRGNLPAEQHSCEERVVYTTFPNNLRKGDFEEYIDRKFSNLTGMIRKEMKCLRSGNRDTDMGQNVYLIDEPDGSKTAVLIQMLYETNADSNEIQISVGYVKYTTKSEQYRNQLQHDWQMNKDRIERALQYKYGLQLQGELD